MNQRSGSCNQIKKVLNDNGKGDLKKVTTVMGAHTIRETTLSFILKINIIQTEAEVRVTSYWKKTPTPDILVLNHTEKGLRCVERHFLAFRSLGS